MSWRISQNSLFSWKRIHLCVRIFPKILLLLSGTSSKNARINSSITLITILKKWSSFRSIFRVNKIKTINLVNLITLTLSFRDWRTLETIAILTPLSTVSITLPTSDHLFSVQTKSTLLSYSWHSFFAIFPCKLCFLCLDLKPKVSREKLFTDFADPIEELMKVFMKMEATENNQDIESH